MDSAKKHGWRRFFQQRKNRNLGHKLHFLQPEEVLLLKSEPTSTPRECEEKQLSRLEKDIKCLQ